MDELLGPVGKLVGSVSLALGLLIAVAKIWSLLNRSNERREDRATFKEIAEAKDNEIARRDARIAELEQRLQVRRDNEHRLNNTIMKQNDMLQRANDYLLIFALELGRKPPDLSDDDPPKLEA